MGGDRPNRRGLVDLFNMCLFKDVVQRFEVRDIDKLTAISVYLLASTSRQISASRLKGLLCRSVDQARGFLGHLERSGLVSLVPRIEDGRRSWARAARRCFSADCGLSVALSGRELEMRDLAETAVFHELLRHRLRVLAWKARGRLGLAVAGDSLPRLMIDVSYGDRQKDGARALASAMGVHSCPTGLMLGDDEEGEVVTPNGTVVKRNFSKWLEHPELPGISPVVRPARKKSKPKPKKAEPASSRPAGLPRHLL